MKARRDIEGRKLDHAVEQVVTQHAPVLDHCEVGEVAQAIVGDHITGRAVRIPQEGMIGTPCGRRDVHLDSRTKALLQCTRCGIQSTLRGLVENHGDAIAGRECRHQGVEHRQAKKDALRPHVAVAQVAGIQHQRVDRVRGIGGGDREALAPLFRRSGGAVQLGLETLDDLGRLAGAKPGGAGAMNPRACRRRRGRGELALQILHFEQPVAQVALGRFRLA